MAGKGGKEGIVKSKKMKNKPDAKSVKEGKPKKKDGRKRQLEPDAKSREGTVKSKKIKNKPDAKSREGKLKKKDAKSIKHNTRRSSQIRSKAQRGNTKRKAKEEFFLPQAVINR